MPNGPGVTSPNLPRVLGSEPSSVLLYARSRRDLDPIAAEIGLRFTPNCAWIEVLGLDTDDRPETQPDQAISRAFESRFEYPPEDLLPNHARSNLAVWAAGRESGTGAVLEELGDLAWLPAPLQELATGAWDGPGFRTAVVARAELLVLAMPLGLEDARRLIATLRARSIALVAALLVRPIPPFTQLFDYVIRVKRDPTSNSGQVQLVVERSPEDGH